MKKIKSLLPALLFLMLLSACVYESDVAIDEPSVKVSPKLMFSWEDKNDHDVYVIKALDDYTYAIEVKHADGSKPEMLNAYASIVDGKTFLNVWDASKKASRAYKLFRFKLLSDSLMQMSPLTSNIRERFSVSADLKKFISENMDHSFFYEADIELKRIQSKK